MSKEQILQEIMGMGTEQQNFITGVAVGIMQASANAKKEEQEKQNAEDQK